MEVFVGQLVSHNSVQKNSPSMNAPARGAAHLIAAWPIVAALIKFEQSATENEKDLDFIVFW